MTSGQVLVVTSVPKTNHVDTPHGHHRQTISLPDDVTMTEVEETVPADGQ